MKFLMQQAILKQKIHWNFVKLLSFLSLRFYENAKACDLSLMQSILTDDAGLCTGDGLLCFIVE